MTRYITLTVFCLLTAQVTAQVLSKEEAIQIVMENNFDIRVANNDLEIAENNTGILNSGYLPTLNGTAGITYNSDNLNAQFQDGRTTELTGAQSDSRTAGLSLNYVLFNGFNRKYNMELNRENLNLSQLNARAILETVMLDLFTAYYDVARNEQTIKTLRETLDISKDRLLRSEYGYDYGRNSKLDVTNAQVDVNTDSINYLNATQSLATAQRNLNLILGQESLTMMEVDTTLNLKGLKDYEAFREAVLTQNTNLLSARSGVRQSQLSVKTNQSRYFPTLSLSGNYNYRLGNNNQASFLASSTSTGLSGSVNLNWDLFDGGTTSVATENAKINQMSQQVLLEQTKQQVIINFENAWNDYQNKVFIVQAQQNNLEANQQNFERTQEQYRLGQIPSLDFRTAQSNLLTAQTDYINARYEAKLAELVIYQLAGRIQEAEF